MEPHGDKKAGPAFIGDQFKLPRVPFHLNRIGFVTVVLLLIAVPIFMTCIVYIEPFEYGIKEVNIGVKRGIQSKVYTPGYAFLIPGAEKMHRFPRNVQVLELTGFPEEAAKTNAAHYRENAAKIQTSDGFFVDVDVTILYKIVDPYKLITSVGQGTLYLTNGILPKAEPALKQTFGELATEDFYNSPMRVEKAENAKELLNKELEEKGMHVDQVLVRYFKYSEEIQKNIELKKLQDQLVFKNQSEAKAAMEEANLKRVTQEGEMRAKVALQQGDSYKVKRNAERDLYSRQRKAEADLLVKLAEAKRTELKQSVLRGVGADRMVAQKMAEVLDGLETVIIPSGGANGLNPLDLNQVLTLFGASGNVYGEEPAPETAAPYEALPSPIKIPPSPLPAIEPPKLEPAPSEMAPAAVKTVQEGSK